MKVKTLEELFVHELKDLHSAEKQLIAALPKMAKNASNPDLKNAFETHLEQTEEHLNRIQRCFDELGEPVGRHKCLGMEGLIEEAKDTIKDMEDEDVLDAALIGSAQRAEHYEIAAYGTARTYAQMLGHDKIAETLQQTLDEEKETDQKLTELAESHVNAEAKA